MTCTRPGAAAIKRGLLFHKLGHTYALLQRNGSNFSSNCWLSSCKSWAVIVRNTSLSRGARSMQCCCAASTGEVRSKLQKPGSTIAKASNRLIVALDMLLSVHNAIIAILHSAPSFGGLVHFLPCFYRSCSKCTEQVLADCSQEISILLTICQHLLSLWEVVEAFLSMLAWKTRPRGADVSGLRDGCGRETLQAELVQHRINSDWPDVAYLVSGISQRSLSLPEH